MPNPQHHIETFVNDVLPTAAARATPIIAAVGGAVVSRPGFVETINAYLPVAIGCLTVVWLVTQISLAWYKAIKGKA